MGTFLLLLIAAGLAYLGYQLRRLVGFIEARQPTPLPRRRRFARVRDLFSSHRRVFIPRIGVSVNGSVAMLYTVLFFLFWAAWALSALTAH